MGMWRGAFLALVCSSSACGGSEFESKPTSGGGTGGIDGGGGSTATGGSSGASAGGTSFGGNAGVGGAAGSAGGAGSGAGGSAGTRPISIVNESGTMLTTTADVPTLTLGFTPAAGNAIIVGITCLSTADGLSPGDCVIDPGGVTDNQGNSYTRAVQGLPILSSEQGARAYIFIAENIASPPGAFTISVDPVGTVPPETQLMVAGAIEVAGLGAPPSLDAWNIGLVAGDPATSTSVITDLPTTQANELAIGVLAMRSNDTNMLITPEAGWTTHQQNQNGVDNYPPGHQMVSRVTTSTGHVSHTWTHDAPSRGVSAVIATFRGALEN